MTTMDRRLPKNIEIAPNSLSIVLKPTTVDKEKPPKTGRALFQDLQNENKLNFWNRELSESVLQLNYLGWFEPDTLFIQGGDKEMSVVREAYARRVLKPPRHHTIQILGDVEAIELTPVPQSQFVPLTEVLCLIIAELNKRKIIATVDKIKAKLADCYGDVKLPSEEILKKSLAHLIKEQKVCHTGEGYFIVTPEDFLYLRSCASSTTTSEVNVSPISQNSNQSGQSSEGQPRKTQKTVRHAVQISTEKGTHTRKKEPPSPRSKSLPPNLSHRDLKNGDSPVRNRSTSLQRSNSLREKKAQASKSNNFQRAGSVRTPVVTTGTHMSNASDSDASKIADNCGNAFGFGKLFRKSFGKKGKKIDDNRREKERDKEKIKDKEKDTVDNKETKDKKIDLLTFSAQFPPEDWPQVLQEMKRKAAVIKRDKNGGKYETSLVNHNGGSPKASPKKDHVVICDEVEHIPGPSTSKDRKIKVYRKKDDSDPLPESEAEFIIPTKMYDDKCRTKAVSEQLRKQYSRKHKEDPWKYLREKEGKAMKKNTEKEAAVNGVNGTRPKRTSAKERPKSDPRDIRLRSIAQIRTAEYVSKLPTSADVNDVQHWDDDIHLDVDSSEFTTSDNNRVLSHRAKSNLRSPKKATADHDFESSDMTPSEDLRGRHTSRHYRAIKRDATKIIRDIQSRVDDTSDTFTSDQEDYATHHHQYLQRPRPKSDGYMLSSQQQDYYDTSTTMETTEQYDDDDDDEDRNCSTPPLPASHDLLDLPLPDSYLDHPDTSLESSEGSVPLPDGEYNGQHTPLRLSPIKESQESQMSLDRSKASQQSLDGRAQQVRMEAPNDFIEHDESPSMLSIETSDSAPSTVIGKDEISPAKEKSIHLPSESFSSSACDSGFNSPRGSIALSRHSNTPIEHMTYDQLREKRLSYCIPEGIELKDFEAQKVSSHIPKSKHNSPDKERPSLIPTVNNGNRNGNGTTQIPSKPHSSKLGSTHSEMRVEKEISQANHKEIAQPRQHEALKVL